MLTAVSTGARERKIASDARNGCAEEDPRAPGLAEVQNQTAKPVLDIFKAAMGRLVPIALTHFERLIANASFPIEV